MKIKIKRCSIPIVNLLMAMVLILPMYGFAQQPYYRFDHLTNEDGLSQNLVSSILQDHKGFMWFGTSDGLNRYDGYRFMIFKHDPFDSASISGNNVSNIFEDSKGRLWIGASGLNLFDPETETFLRFHYDFSYSKEQMNLNKLSINAICEDHHGSLWIALNGGGLLKVDFDSVSTKHSAMPLANFTHYFHDSQNPTSLLSDYVFDVLVDRAGILWAGTDKGLNKLDLNSPNAENGRFIAYTKISDDLIEPGIFSIYEDKKDGLWLGSHGLIRIDKKAERFYYYPHQKGIFIDHYNERIVEICEDRQGKLWLATPGALVIFDPEREKYQYIRKNPLDPVSISMDGILSLYEDDGGIMWVGTAGRGVNKYNHRIQQFHYYYGSPDQKLFPSELNITSILEEEKSDGNRLWFSTSEGGLYHLNRTKGQVKRFEACGINEFSVLSMLQDEIGIIWIGTQNGLFKYDRQTNQISFHDLNPIATNVIFKQIFCLYEDTDGNLWIGSYGLLCKKAKNTTAFVSYPITFSDTSAVLIPEIKAIYRDRKGMLWLGSSEGLIRFNPQDLTLKTYRNDPQNSDGLSYNHILSLTPDPYQSDKFLWIGTSGGGLNRFEFAIEKFVHFTVSDGLPSNLIYSVLADDENNLWMSTNKGLSRFLLSEIKASKINPSYQVKKLFKNYNMSHGLQGNEFNSGAYFKSKSGELFFGGIRGFNSFYPDQIEDNQHIPPIVLTDFQLFYRSMPIRTIGDLSFKKNISTIKEMTLKHDRNLITFEFAALDYSAPQKNEYAYKLENFDKDWIYTGTQRRATYSNLPPGNYVFKVKGSNSDGVWNEQGTSMKIMVLPPWWRTIWAYIFYGIVFALGVFVVDRVQRSRLIARERERARLQQAELRTEAAELKAKAMEAQARAIQAEHERKTHELEEARKLQMSMLPQKLPDIENLDIAVYMKTATEVGGDYYDFDLSDDGLLTVAVGDATDHGLKAGIMVSIIKGLFYADAAKSKIDTFFKSCTRTIKQMRLGNLYMALTLLKIRDHEMVVSAAGMPPIYIYRAENKKVEEIIIKGMPLGAFIDFKYQQKKIKLNTGDAILLSTDGLAESFKDGKEMFDYHRIKKCFGEVGHKSSEEIIEHLINTGEVWCECTLNHDDITFVVLKMK